MSRSTPDNNPAPAATALQRPARAPRVPMAELPADTRCTNFDEVALGYTPDQACREAGRCLRCKKPTCEVGCPVGVTIRDFIAAIADDDLPRAVKLLKERNALPAVCGRVCPQETQCEATCILAKKGEAVAIGRLERFLADWDRSLPREQRNATVLAPKKKQLAAVIGSGPAGLACAGELALLGWRVELFEALHTAGGVLAYGIPEFRLPRAVLADEIDLLRRARVKFRFNELVGRITSAEELLAQGYDAVFLGLGAGLPLFLGIEGENLSGVYSANEYLTRVNLMRARDFPTHADTPVWQGSRVIVIGGGNVAVDAARTARRLGATEVTIAYRRTQAEMPARLEEVRHAKAEGVAIEELVAPLAITGEEGWADGLQVQPLYLEPAPADSRQRPRPLPDAKPRLLPADTVIIAIGTRAQPCLELVADIETTEADYLKTDEVGRTSNPRIYAGGDAVTGSATVIEAMGAGKKAARAIHRSWG